MKTQKFVVTVYQQHSAQFMAIMAKLMEKNSEHFFVAACQEYAESNPLENLFRATPPPQVQPQPAPQYMPPAIQQQPQPAPQLVQSQGGIPVQGMPNVYADPNRVNPDGSFYLSRIVDPQSSRVIWEGHPEGFGAFRGTKSGNLIAPHETAKGFNGRPLACFISKRSGEDIITKQPILAYMPRIPVVGLQLWTNVTTPLQHIQQYLASVGVATAPPQPSVQQPVQGVPQFNPPSVVPSTARRSRK